MSVGLASDIIRSVALSMLAWGGLAKLLDGRDQWVRSALATIPAHGRLEQLVEWVLRRIPALEIALSTWLLVGRDAQVPALFASLTFAVFAVILGRSLVTGQRSCYCYGVESTRVSPLHVGVNLGLAGFFGYSAVTSRHWVLAPFVADYWLTAAITITAVLLGCVMSLVLRLNALGASHARGEGFTNSKELVRAWAAWKSDRDGTPVTVSGKV